MWIHLGKRSLIDFKLERITKLTIIFASVIFSISFFTPLYKLNLIISVDNMYIWSMGVGVFVPFATSFTLFIFLLKQLKQEEEYLKTLVLNLAFLILTVLNINSQITLQNKDNIIEVASGGFGYFIIIASTSLILIATIIQVVKEYILETDN